MRAWTAKPRGAATAAWLGEPQRLQGLAGGDAELGLDQIDAGDLFGDRVLDLDARIALDETMFAALGDDQELDRAGVHIAGRAGEPDRVAQDALAQRRVEPGRRGDLDDLLVAKLDRAVALVEVDDVAAGCRPGSGPRCAGAARPAFRGTPRRRRRRPAPRCWQRAKAAAISPAHEQPRACRARRRRPRLSASPDSRAPRRPPPPRPRSRAAPGCRG